MAAGPGKRAHGRVGTMVRDKYRIDAFLATGSMANVYAATHRNGSRVALKVLHADYARDPGMAERFKREGYFANTIGHPGVIRAIDDDVTEDGCAFLVMELLEGENLDERRKRLGGKIAPQDALEIADAILEILAAAHGKDVLHRDLKPENVYVTTSGEVKLLDFGVARWNDGQSESEMTAMGMVLGTPAFMPPEQALGRREEVDARSDIWGVGATLFMILTGESVHTGSDAKAKLIATARTPARPLREVDPEVPRAVASVVDRALAFDKKDRWPDAGAMREALKWARLSVDGEDPTLVHQRREDFLVPTRRASADLDGLDSDDIPTLSGRTEDVFTSAPPITLRDAPRQARASRPATEEVARAAHPSNAPLARRSGPPAPPGPAQTEMPTFALRKDVELALRLQSGLAEKERTPATERVPTSELGEDDPTLAGDSRAFDGPLALTKPAIPAPALLAHSGAPAAPPAPETAEARALQAAETVVPNVPAPRPAAGAPADQDPRSRPVTPVAPFGPSAHSRDAGGPASPVGQARHPTQPTQPSPVVDPSLMAAGSHRPPPVNVSTTTLAGIGAPPAPRMATAPMQAMPMGSAPPAASGSMPPQAHGSMPPQASTGYPSYGPPPNSDPSASGRHRPIHEVHAQYAQTALALGSAPPPAYGARPVHSEPPPHVAQPSGFPPAASGSHPSVASVAPGPLLATIAPNRGGRAMRIIFSVVLAFAAGIGTWIAIVRHRAPEAVAGATPASAIVPAANVPAAASASSTSAATPTASNVPVMPASAMPNAPPPTADPGNANAQSGANAGAAETASAEAQNAPTPKAAPKRKKHAKPATAPSAPAAPPASSGGDPPSDPTTAAPEPPAKPPEPVKPPEPEADPTALPKKVDEPQ